MAWPELYQRAILQIREVIARGGRVLRSSRAFWSKFGFPDIGERQRMIAEARDLLSVSQQIESQISNPTLPSAIRGTIAEAISSAGIPTTDLSGGLTGGMEASVWARVRFGTEESGYSYRTFKLGLAWYSSIDQLEYAIDEAIEALGDAYGLDGGVIAPGTLAIY